MEGTGSAPVGMGTAPSGPATSTAASDVAGQASALAGNAPGESGDATVEGQQAGAPPPDAAPAEFQILNRKFRDQKHAEEILGSEISRTRAMQRENAALKSQLQEIQTELQSLRPMVAALRGGGPGQGGPQGAQPPAGPRSFADELGGSIDYSLYQRIAEDPEMGLGHALFAQHQDLAKAFDQRLQAEIGRLRSEMIEPMVRREQIAPVVARGISTARELAKEFPELDESNQSDEALEAQQAVLSYFEDSPRVQLADGRETTVAALWLATNPGDALRAAVMSYRQTHGVPVFAQAPGMSGSPSGLAASAAEAAAARATASPLDGSGVPRQRPSGQPETFADKVRRENREVAKVARTPSGRPLGFEATG